MTLIGREPQLEELARVAGLGAFAPRRAQASDECLPPSRQPVEVPAPLVVVYGGASTGKSASVALALRRRAAAFALVDCAAVYSAQDFYRDTLAQLYKNAADQSLHIHRRQHEEEEDESERNHSVVVVTGQDDRPDAHHASANGTEAFEGYASLNFLAFFKALGEFMDRSGLASRSSSAGHEPVLYLALDHVDRLLDRGLAALLSCVLAINEQLGYSRVFDDAPPWRTCVLLMTRGVSAALDRLISPFFPVYVCFPPYSPDQIVTILAAQFGLAEERRAFRRWALHLHGLLPPSAQDDWLEFRACVAHLLPEFRDQLQVFEKTLEASDTTASTAISTPTATASTPTASPMGKTASPRAPKSPKATAQMQKLVRDTNRRVSNLLMTRRRHLFGYDKLRRPGASDAATASSSANRGNEDQLLACASLNRGCLLLVLAGYLASFNPQESDAKFLSSAGGPRRKKRRSKKDQAGADSASTSTASATPQHVSQRLIGPKIFTLQRLLAIYLNLRAEATAAADAIDTREAREDIITHLATLVRMQLFQRTSPPTVLDDIKFRCLADWRFVQEAARFLKFPIEAYLNS